MDCGGVVQGGEGGNIDDDHEGDHDVVRVGGAGDDGTVTGLLSAHHERCFFSAIRLSREWSPRRGTGSTIGFDGIGKSGGNNAMRGAASTEALGRPRSSDDDVRHRCRCRGLCRALSSPPRDDNDLATATVVTPVPHVLPPGSRTWLEMSASCRGFSPPKWPTHRHVGAMSPTRHGPCRRH